MCSGAPKFEIEALLEQFGLRRMIATVVAIDDVGVSKPDPAGYRLTLERLRGITPDIVASECLVIEDSLHGTAAGKAAGMRVVAVQTHYSADQLASADPSVARLEGVSPDDLATRLH